MVRLANSNDLESVIQLAERKIYPTLPSQAPEDSPLSFLRGLRHDDGWREEHDLFVSEEANDLTGYLVLKKRLIRGITAERESVIKDVYAARSQNEKVLIERAIEAARDYGSQFLTIEIAPSESELRELLKLLDFGLESHRISVKTAEERIPQGSPYTVRPATPADDFLIGVLNSTMLGHTLVAGRDYDMSSLTFASMSLVMAQVNRTDAKSAGLVLCLNDQLVGHLLLDLTERTGYISDLALEREHWGGTAVRHLMRAGSRLLFERKIPLFVGDVSAANRRALVVAQRALGFAIESQRYGLKLT